MAEIGAMRYVICEEISSRSSGAASRMPSRQFCDLCGLAHQRLFNPSPGFVRCLEQRCVTNVAFAEPGFQMPPPRVLRVMVLAVEADDHSGKIAVREDEPTRTAW